MSDILSVAFGSLSPNRKILCAISSNLAEEFLKLLGTYSDLMSKAVIQEQNERTALHLCAVHGRYWMAQRLLEGGSDPLKNDLFGNTPLDLSLKNNNAELSTLLLTTCPYILPQHLHEKDYSVYSDETQELIVLATPSLFGQFSEAKDDVINISKLNEPFLKMCFMTGNRIDPKKINKNMSEWLQRKIWKVQDLQNLARIAVRKAMHQNIFYASNKLCIPKQLKTYLISFE